MNEELLEHMSKKRNPTYHSFHDQFEKDRE